MTTQNSPKIIEANRIDNGIVIKFDDGKQAFYPPALLLEVFPRAAELIESATDKRKA